MPEQKLDEFGKSIYTIADSTPQKNQVKLASMLEGGNSDSGGKLPAYYNNKFNKILDNIVCKSSDGKWLTTKDDTTNEKEFVMTSSACSNLAVGKLLSSTSENALKENTNTIVKIINQLDSLKSSLLGDGGGIPNQAKIIMKDDINLSSDQQILLNKIDKLQEFKKYGSIETNEIAYTGKSKKILELVYYISAIGIMGLFIINQLKKGK